MARWDMVTPLEKFVRDHAHVVGLTAAAAAESLRLVRFRPLDYEEMMDVLRSPEWQTLWKGSADSIRNCSIISKVLYDI